MSYNKIEVKEVIELEDVYTLLEFFEAEPQIYGNYIVAQTICHQGDSHKLYYYENTQLFKCFTGSCGTFDIFELVQKVRQIDDLNAAIYFVVNFLNLQGKVSETDDNFSIEDWKYINANKKIKEISPTTYEEVKLPEYDSSLLQFYPRPHIIPWEKEHINKQVCDYMGICYEPLNGSIIIPHYDIEGRLVGIRQRTLIQEQEQWGKYRPIKINGKLYNHPLGFNLYGLNRAKHRIQEMKIAIVFESEKSVLQYISYFGTKNNLAIAVCGSSISKYQMQLLRNLGIEEVVVGFDKDFQELYDDNYFKVEDKILKIYQKYGSYIKLSFLFDLKNELLDYKNSPTDKGKEVFLELFEKRVIPSGISKK